MRISRVNQSLILISLVAVIFDLARLDLWGTSNLLYLIWNLFLAWIPYVISSCFIKKEMAMNRFIPFFILWLLFFPNAPYLVTDALHLVSSLPVMLWYDSLLLFFFGWIGLFLGMLSLFRIHQYFQVHFSRLVSELGVFIVCFISGFGIYLGRFERWNSWDLFISPLGLARHSLNAGASLTHMGTPLVFVVVFSVFMYSVYKTVYFLLTEKIEL